MAGHSKWANIKRHKSKQDAKRGKLYTKLIREITVAAKLGGSDPFANPRLRTALDKALEGNMTKEVIERAIKRGAGGMEGEELEEIRYEGYGPDGIAIIVDCLTNNRNRTVADVRHAFTKHGGNLGLDGSVAYLFKKIGHLIYAPGADEERLMELALEMGADDIIVNDDKSIEVITSPETFLALKQKLIKSGLKPDQADISLIASMLISVANEENAQKLTALIEALEDLDDIQNVYTNQQL